MRSNATTLNIILFGSMIITAGVCVKVQERAVNDLKYFRMKNDTLNIQNKEFVRIFKQARESCREQGKNACRSCIYFEFYKLKK